MSLSCYLVIVAGKRKAMLTWSRSGGDHEYLTVTRRASITITAETKKAAVARAEGLGRNILGGRPVTVLSVEYLHPANNWSHGDFEEESEAEAGV